MFLGPGSGCTVGRQDPGIPQAENRELFENFSAPFPVPNNSWAAENKPLGCADFWQQGAIHAKPTGRLEARLREAMFTKTHCSLITARLRVWVSPGTRFVLVPEPPVRWQQEIIPVYMDCPLCTSCPLLSGSDRESAQEGLAAEAAFELVNIFTMSEQDDVLSFVRLKAPKTSTWWEKWPPEVQLPRSRYRAW